MVRSRSPGGFTFIELLVILAILGFLVGFIVPIIARVRLGATRTQSINNLKQLALAVHNFHDANKKFPPIVGIVGGSFGTAHFHLLPYVEQNSLYNSAGGAVWRNGVSGTVIGLFLDNRDKSAPDDFRFNWLATTNYAASWPVFKQGDLSLANILDGSSNTFMFTVRYQICHGAPTAWGYPALYTWAPMFGYYSQAKFQVTPTQDECDPALPQSLSAAGIEVAMCDGSVRIVNRNVSPQTWWYATDPTDGNSLGRDFED
jgi:type II secretory pathway pseudopilin PulG